MREAHKSKFAVHPGATKMYHDLTRYYHWIHMKADVDEWVAKCPTCQLIKAKHQVPSGLLQSLPILEWKWDHITMHFVTGFPTTRNKKDAVWVIVDRLTKSAHFLAIRKSDGVDRIVCKYLDEIVRLHGILVTWCVFCSSRCAASIALELRSSVDAKCDPSIDGFIDSLDDQLRILLF
ncbi:hypothetical protein N665_0022s0006 [Sinapis alba]|nr:hypothetical protein N665_0022s0006 [Sinapis alba]